MTPPDPRLDEIQARLSAATPGPWEIIGGNEYLTGIDVAIGSWDEGGIRLRDAEFIAMAPGDVRYLLAELRKAHEALARVEGLHQREVIAVHEGYGEEAICTECGHRWPCDTRAAVAAANGDGK